MGGMKKGGIKKGGCPTLLYPTLSYPTLSYPTLQTEPIRRLYQEGVGRVRREEVLVVAQSSEIAAVLVALLSPLTPDQE
jgi:hypothetical protein